jgi:RimJ/RimL family protein N-acetyltransferase
MFDTSRYSDPSPMGEHIPPTRIETPRLVLRCWSPSDAPLLKAAIDLSIDHLRRWMPWAFDEPSELHEVEERLARYRSEFLQGAGFVYGLFDSTEAEVVGGSGLMPRVGPRALEIGYWIRVDRTGQGLATEATRALTSAGLALPDIDRTQIHVDPKNAASASIPRKLGYRLVETRRGNKQTPEGELRDTLVFECSTDLRSEAGTPGDATAP